MCMCRRGVATGAPHGWPKPLREASADPPAIIHRERDLIVCSLLGDGDGSVARLKGSLVECWSFFGVCWSQAGTMQSVGL